MGRTLRVIGSVVTAIVVGGLVSSSGLGARSGGEALGPTVTAYLPVEELAADGTLAAANLRNSKEDATDCGRIIVWNAATGRVVNAYSYEYCDLERLSKVTVAGNRVAWVLDHEEGEMSSELSLQLFDLTSRSRITVKNVWPDGISLSDADIGNVVGKGRLLVFNTWRDNSPASTGRLWRYDAPDKKLRYGLLRSGASAMAPVDVDANRILVKRADGHLVVLKDDGSIVRDLPFRRGQPRTARLDGSSIIVQTKNSVVTYDISSGHAERSWPMTSLEDVQAGIAVSRHGDGIHLLRLSDGERTTIPLRSVVATSLTSAGLFYARSLGPRRSQLGFIQTSSVLARLR